MSVLSSWKIYPHHMCYIFMVYFCNLQGDLIINVPNVIEAVTKIVSVSDNTEILKIAATER